MIVNRHALLIGAGGCCEGDCPDLHSRDDVEQISLLLKYNEDKTKNFEVKTCMDETNSDIVLNIIRDLFNHNDDCALLYFSGHGFLKNGSSYIELTGGGSVLMDDIFRCASKSKSKHRIISLDCCFSGSMGADIFDSNVVPLSKGMTIMTSCSEQELSDEGKSHGLFTELLLNGLKGGASDILGNITPGSLYSYIDNSLTPWDQRPLFKTNISQFISLRTVISPVSLDVLRQLPRLFKNPDCELQLDPSYEFTNNPDVEHKLVEPYAIEENVSKFKMLQKMERIGLIVPIGEEHMYYAAMNFKKCKLTSLGKHYFKLAKEEII